MTSLDAPQFWLNLARVGILLFTAFISWVTYRSHLLLKEFEPDFNILLSLPESGARLLLGGMCLLLAWLTGLPAAELGLTVTNLWASLGIGLVIGLVTQLVIFGASTWAIQKFGRDIYSPWLITNILPKKPIDWPLVALAFGPPVLMEELLFRTLLIGAFREIVPLAIWITAISVIFGLMHQPQGRLGMLFAGLINVIFSLVFVWTGQLLVTFVAHYTVNMLQVVAAHFQRYWLENY